VTEFKLPNLGDGVAAGDVLRVLVKAGDTLKADQAVLELETDKATLEVPSTVVLYVHGYRDDAAARSPR
jgi:pyruvate dehydrogenase E2 component (dihydrolipoamide acetyltransferase)